MIKKILFIQIISLILFSCACFPLEEKPVTHMSDNLTKDEKMLIKRQIEDQWSTVDLKNIIENIKVKTKIELDIDGSVTKAEITSFTCPPEADKICVFMVESIKKAVKKASPIKNLRSDRYDVWKTFELDFYPGVIK